MDSTALDEEENPVLESARQHQHESKNKHTCDNRKRESAGTLDDDNPNTFDSLSDDDEFKKLTSKSKSKVR